MFSRLSSLTLTTLALGLAFAASTQAQNPPLDTVRVASGLTLPLYVTAPPGDTSRLFIVEQRIGTTGRVRILQIPGNTLLATPFLSVTPVTTGNEQGLLGLAFHPNYASNGTFFVAYSTTGGGPAGRNVVAKCTVSADPNVANTALDIILEVNDPFSNHNGGWIAFGPDNMLYIAMGDGGSGGDPNGNGQNIDALLGKFLRIDVDGDDFPGDAAKDYRIPSTNPFATTAGADEVWHYGVRNSWRNSFDRLTGDLYIGDVGQNAIEEIDVAPAGMGGLNFGWRCMEGNSCTGDSGCTCFAATLTPPVTTYSHTGGACSVTGGYVYRGSAICGLQGTYFFADYCSQLISSFRYTGSVNPTITARTTELSPGGGLAINSPTSFGEDAAGEMYIVDQGGEIFKIVPGPITDCNSNGIHDGCDIASATSADTNLNGVPDECESTITPFCFGTTALCPCGNGGAPGNGCANSLFPAGALLAGSGTADISNDSFTLIGTNMPDSSALFFQGTAQVAGGAGTPFGDGLRCAGGSIVRLELLVNQAGSSTIPGIFDPPISAQAGITGGPVTRTYQIWYRNPATFCTALTYNLTNGVSVLWVN